jgi:hypothetical protein
MEDETRSPIGTEETEHTHKATLTVYSNGKKEMISVKVQLEPDVEGVSIEELGYLPAAYQFMEEYIFPAIEAAYMDWQIKPMLALESPSKWNN